MSIYRLAISFGRPIRALPVVCSSRQVVPRAGHTPTHSSRPTEEIIKPVCCSFMSSLQFRLRCLQSMAFEGQPCVPTCDTAQTCCGRGSYHWDPAAPAPNPAPVPAEPAAEPAAGPPECDGFSGSTPCCYTAWEGEVCVTEHGSQSVCEADAVDGVNGVWCPAGPTPPPPPPNGTAPALNGTAPGGEGADCSTNADCSSGLFCAIECFTGVGCDGNTVGQFCMPCDECHDGSDAVEDTCGSCEPGGGGSMVCRFAPREHAAALKR